jgi:Flp pilus assembly protein TadB
VDDRERQELELIERQVLASDPRLAALLARHDGRPRPEARSVALFAVSALLVAFTVGLLAMDLVTEACLVMLVTAWPMVVLRRLRPPPGWRLEQRR